MVYIRKLLHASMFAQCADHVYICLANLAANTTALYRKTMQWPLQGETLNNLTMLYRSPVLFPHSPRIDAVAAQDKIIDSRENAKRITCDAVQGVLKARNVEETYYRRLNSELGSSDLIFILLPLKEAQIKKRRIVSVRKNN